MKDEERRELSLSLAKLIAQNEKLRSSDDGRTAGVLLYFIMVLITLPGAIQVMLQMCGKLLAANAMLIAKQNRDLDTAIRAQELLDEIS